MKILFVGWYDAAYSRNAVLLKALAVAGVACKEYRVARNQRFKAIRLWWMIFRHREKYDAIVVPFSGQEVMIGLSLYGKVPIIFDAFTSHFEGYILDRALATPRSLRALRYWLLDWYACKRAAMILVDTKAHAEYFSSAFHVPRDRIQVVYVGSMLSEIVEETRIPADPVIHFHGSNIPLQGISVVFDAIRRLKATNIRFQLIGPFEIPPDIESQVHHIRYVPFSELPHYITAASVCLGIFGVGQKTQRVIPNKVYEAISCYRPVISADTPAMREVFDDRSILFVPAGDAESLAQAIIRSTSSGFDAEARVKHARMQLNDRASIAIVSRDLRALLHDTTLRA